MTASQKRYLILKRGADIALSATLLVALAPLFFVLIAASLCFMGRPVFFTQRRPGRHGQPFTLLKFRTMRVATEGVLEDSGSGALSAGAASDVALVGTDELRLTKYGSFLRASSLDELPELVNILKGDMSFVGPRPLLMEYLPLYSQRQARRHDVRPGLTGLAQVHGRNALNWDDRLEYDAQYSERVSLALDLSILARTIGVVFSRRGVSDGEHATVAPFTGGASTDDCDKIG